MLIAIQAGMSYATASTIFLAVTPARNTSGPFLTASKQLEVLTLESAELHMARTLSCKPVYFAVVPNNILSQDSDNTAA